MRQEFAVAVAVAVVGGLSVGGQVSAQGSDLERVALEKSKRLEIRAARQAGIENLRSIYDQQIGTGNYHIRIGVYGVIQPSIFPTVNWVQMACFSDPGRNYSGGGNGLVYVDAILLLNGSTVWDTRNKTGLLERGVCYVDDGVDTTFVEIPRSLTFDSWEIFIRYGEMQSDGISYSKELFPVHIYQ